MMEESPSRGPPRSPESERNLIRDITVAAEAQAKEGDIFFLITHRWWQHWLDYVNQDSASTADNGLYPYASHHHDSACSSTPKRPLAIDNSDLIYDMTSEVSSMEIELRDTLVEGRDYILLPQEVWEKLHGWYGGGPTLPRIAINSGFSQTDLAIEVYPLRLQLLLIPKGERAIARISKRETVGELHRKACEVFDLLPDHVSIWDYYGNQKHALMDEMEKTLDDANIQMDQDILLEVHTGGYSIGNGTCISSVQENGSLEKDSTSLIAEPCKSSLSVAEGLSTSKTVSRSCSSEQAQSQYIASPVSDLDNLHVTNGVTTRGATVGLMGLYNLGNTCFMNSAIQCLVHTPEFAKYFRGDYHQEINWQNPLGMVGELALAFGELLRRLWAPGRGSVYPRQFKAKLARFAPQFSGFAQHDSQELLAFLLDGLHEDLNRVRDKPYVNSKDADGRPDEEVADEYWANHIARNDSIIVDVCQGQYKSTLICPVCAKVSVTFDPFMYLSLPLQSPSTRSMTVLVFTGDGGALPTSCTVSVPKQGRLKDLVQALSNSSLLKNEEKLVIAKIHDHSVYSILEDPSLLLSTIKDDDHLAAYKLPKVAKHPVTLQFVHRREAVESGSTRTSTVWRPFGIPLLASVSGDENIRGEDLQRIVLQMLNSFRHPEDIKPSILVKSNMGVASKANQDTTASEPLGSAESVSQDQEPDTTKLVEEAREHLQLFDAKGECIEIISGEDSVIRLSFPTMLMFINWSEKDLKKYNTHYLENLPEVYKSPSASKRARIEPLSLYACLDAFLREEPLVPEDMWYCPRCKERRQASKKLDLWRLPEVLVIHLKRFSFSRSSKSKLETFVNFPIHDFDLTNYVARKGSPQRQLYELYALSNHYGGMGSGHYTSYIKLLDENKWYNFDDNHIYPLAEDDVKSNAAYVLFYRRVKVDE